MKSNFEEKRAAQVERFQELADKNESLSDSAYKAATQIASYIPMGQPILVGHHSEKRHRRDIQRIDNNMRKSVEADEKAAYYRGRAESLLSNNAISSDDPNALDKLQEKLERLQAAQELMKKCNKITGSKKFSEVEKIQQLQDLGLKESTAVEIMTPRYGRVGLPSYKLTNNNATINSVKKRIQHLESIAKLQTAEIQIGPVTIKMNVEDNRVQIFFPGKPSDEVRTELKRAGFHWSGYVGAWMRLISNYAVDQAKYIVNKFYGQ